ncbi:hypothetical protein JCM4814A_46910 [Streptomyces phaeofaciens JCM 4814]|uniref:Uncharacterized protein n=1 Tax=Streptomyces phaeofaciens TaxID=68254 RepID=A0A918H0S8_9ACTN|nr:DUF6461 domain-containing protein [Streptomyces phaeofaciens]GGT30914.1 hypothetical protein GCM10010226_03580 [Streptomyces phaeofaciens]
MSDGIVWLVDRDGWMSSVVFARGITPEELAVRMGGDPDGATEPITDAEVGRLGITGWRPAADGDGVIRAGSGGEWSFAVEYGDSTGGDLLAEISRDGAEVVRYVPPQEHPPADVHYARDGVWVCGYGLREEIWRWGEEPDLFLPDLVAAGVLSPDGRTYLPPEDEDYKVGLRRSLGVVERRFGLSLSPAVLGDARLPAYAVRGTPRMTLDVS